MALSALFRWMTLPVADVPLWWRGLRIPTKAAAAASMLVIASMMHLGGLVTVHARQSVLHRSAAAAAHDMDSFVGGYARELATKSALSAESRDALERLLSPAATPGCLPLPDIEPLSAVETLARAARQHALNLRSLRDRMEAAGGSVIFSSTPAGPALIAELDLANMEAASG
jgi:hypothetical protein